MEGDIYMSRRKRVKDKEKIATSVAKRQKNAKKNYYASNAAKQKWEDKKKRKSQSQISYRESTGISKECPLASWATPSVENCKGCSVFRCSSTYR